MISPFRSHLIALHYHPLSTGLVQQTYRVVLCCVENHRLANIQIYDDQSARTSPPFRPTPPAADLDLVYTSNQPVGPNMRLYLLCVSAPNRFGVSLSLVSFQLQLIRI